MLSLYSYLTRNGAWLFDYVLDQRIKRGKEDSNRVNEKRGIASRPRPDGQLIWVHAASVGEAQSALILIKEMLEHYDVHILVTTGTKTSANMMKDALPDGAFHQYYPLDYPPWNDAFLKHWRPDLVFWMESELWPNMLGQIKSRHIPAALMNARLSDTSYKRWSLFKNSIKHILESFDLILTQTQLDAQRYENLSARIVRVTGNLKYSAQPLRVNNDDLKKLTGRLMQRPIWLYASSHKGEEELVFRAHRILKSHFPALLSIIVPRHIDRSADIAILGQEADLNICLRGNTKYLPAENDDIYIANTMGELGLFYRLSPLTCIGRSFSDDGGGGHNPIEAAQLHCAILSGPNVQYQQEIFDDMAGVNAARICETESDLVRAIMNLLDNPEALKHQQDTAYDFAKTQSHVIDLVMEKLTPLINQSGLEKRDGI